MENNSNSTMELSPVQRFKKILMSPGTENSFRYALGPKANAYIKSVQMLYNTSPELQRCDPMSIIQCAIASASLGLSVDKNLGEAAIIAFRNGKTGQYDAQLQVMVDGWRHLAMRSGVVEKIITRAVYKTDSVTFDEETGEYIIRFAPPKTAAIDPRNISKQDTTLAGCIKAGIIGYQCYILFKDGSKAKEYWTLERIASHGMTYSRSYNKLWTSNFDAMAKKTVTKLTIKHNVPFDASISLSMDADQKVYDAEGNGAYLDNPNNTESLPERRNATIDEVLPPAQDIPAEEEAAPDIPEEMMQNGELPDSLFEDMPTADGRWADV